MAYMPGSRGILYLSGAPVAGTNEVQTMTIGGTPTGGTFILNVLGFQTGSIAWSATNATLLANIQAALDAVPGVGTNGIVAAAGTLTAGIGTITLTFSGANVAGRAQPTITVVTNALTGTAPTVAIAETTPGVDSSPPFPAVGAIVVNGATGAVLRNSGTPTAPVWTAM